MFDVNKAIYACDDVICRNIESFTTEQRGLLSQNILSQLRNFVENIFVKVYISLGGEPQRKDYDTIRVACSYVKALQGEYRFLSQFHKLLQISVSHYTLDPDSSERLMLKYYEYLLRIRILMKEKFGMKLLANLSQFPLNTDKTFTLYYKAIAQAIEHRAALSTNVHHGRFYIEKIRTIIVENKIYYEVTFIPAHDKSSKFDRIIAFTHLELSDYYAVELHWIETSIKVLTRNMPIIIIVDWQVSIRYCEIKNFSKIFGYDINCQEIKEYVNLMNYLTVTRMNIVELLDLSDTYYEHFEGILQREARRLWISAHIGTISFGNGRQHDRLHRRRADALPRCQLPESARQSGGLRSTQQHHVDCDMGFERASRLREAHRLDGSHAGTGRSRLYRRYPRAYALGCQRGLLPPAHRAFRRGGEEIPPTGDRRVGYCPDRKDGQGNRVGRTRTDGGMDAGTGTGDGHHGLRCRCVAARRNGRCVPHQRKRLRCPYP